MESGKGEVMTLSFEEWAAGVPESLKRDALWSLRIYHNIAEDPTPYSPTSLSPTPHSSNSSTPYSPPPAWYSQEDER